MCPVYTFISPKQSHAIFLIHNDHVFIGSKQPLFVYVWCSLYGHIVNIYIVENIF